MSIPSFTVQQLAGLKSRALRRLQSRTPIHEISSYKCGKSKKCAEQCTTSSCIPRFTLTLLPPRSLKQIIQSHKRKLTIILSKFHRAYQACRTKPGRDNKLLRGINCSSPLVGLIIFKFKDYRNNCSRTAYYTNYNYTTVSLAYAAVNFSPLEQNTL